MNDFDDAVSESLKASVDFEDAVRVVREVVNEYASAVANYTDHLVKVDLVSTSKFRFFTIPENLEKILDRHRRELGDDEEEQTTRVRLLASVSNDSRILWEFEFGKMGFPVTVHGPEKGQTTLCYEPSDLRAVVLKAARSALIGRKIAALRDKALAPASAQTANDRDE